MSDLTNTLGILPLNILFQFISFGLFVLVMYKLLYGPLRQTLQDRRTRIRESLQQAEEMKVQVEEDQKQFDAELRDRQDEARRVREETIRRVADAEQEELHRARQAAEKIRIDAEQDATMLKEQALQEAQREISDLVIDATGKVLDRSIDDPEHRRLVEEALAEVRSQTS